MTEPRARRNVFGESAGEYDAIRLGYPPALIADVLADAGPGPALEVGAGTGKATTAFAEQLSGAGRLSEAAKPSEAGRLSELVCLEPDARMADLLRDKVAGLPGVSIVVDRFETWLPERRYGLVYSAQAWHWIDPEQAPGAAARALAPGGLLALFWNAFMVADGTLHAALAEADRVAFPEGERTTHAWHVDEHPVLEQPFAEEWRWLQLHDDERFTDLRSRHYRWTQIYSAADYARYLATTSLYLMLEPAALDDALTAVREVIDKHGGTIEVTVDTGLATARRT
jgi:SAM-dependent methyltransferase